ncbi:site-specific integrase [Sinosporangium siamense]|uniref:Site-specific integrase n=1 Tax=Sinosporangium siamense TaxID=1367973 RepID=A0A919RPX9_9ACTN|nr:tyrosine-type recombinase/integrase [Sinosporangium siamense]GII96875.1 site-specific integrase [Sinosporangium siamense]
MSGRRSPGDGGLYWDEKRGRWIASLTVGYTAGGRRIVKKASGKSKTEAKNKLKEIIRDYEDGLALTSSNETVAEAVRYWLEHGLKGRGDSTVILYTGFANNHVIPAIGARKLKDLSVEDIDRWLAGKARQLSTRSLKIIYSILNRSMRNAIVRDKVKRNIVALCEIPDGCEGRVSKALNLNQAETVLSSAEQADARIGGYIILSLMTGARTEELRKLSWSHVVAFDAEREVWLPVTETGWNHTDYAVYVWRSVRQGGDTKTAKSRRTLKLPQHAVEALRRLWEHEGLDKTDDCAGLGERLVFTTKNGTALSAGNVRRDFRKVIAKAGLTAAEWTPKELRTASCPCCRTPVSPSSRSHAWSATAIRRSPRPSTASRSTP